MYKTDLQPAVNQMVINLHEYGAYFDLKRALVGFVKSVF